MNNAASGNEISSYHLEAGIAYWHCIKEDAAVKWESILQLYDQLLLINYSPAVALNRIFALYKAKGKEAALQEAAQLPATDSHFYHLLMGELYSQLDDPKSIVTLPKSLCFGQNTNRKTGHPGKDKPAAVKNILPFSIVENQPLINFTPILL